MRPRNLLEVVDERVVHRRTAQCANNWHSLRSKLLRDNDAEAGGDLRDEPHHDRGAFGKHARVRLPGRRTGASSAKGLYR